MKIPRSTALLPWMLAALPALAAEAPTLELIMSDPDWIGNPPVAEYWSDSGANVYYEQKRTGEIYNDLYVVAATGGTATAVAAADEARSSNASRVYNSDRTLVAWVHRGDIMVKELATGRVLQATRTTAEELLPMFMADGRSVAFVREEEYFVYDPVTGTVAEAADVRFEKHPDDKPFDVLRQKQMSTFETLREDQRREDAQESHAEGRQIEDPAGAPVPIYLGDEHAEVDRSLSPSGHFLLIVVKDADAEEGEKGIMPNYVTPEGYTTITETRTRVGRNPPAAQSLLLVNLEERSFVTIDYASLPGIDDDPLRDLRESAVEWYIESGADREEIEEKVEAPDERPLTVEDIAWNHDGTHAAIQLRSIDNKDRWLVTLEPDAGPRLQVQHRLTDPAWINWDYNEFGWLRDGRTLWFLSEESGFSHLYTKSIAERRPRQLTSGEFVVREPELDAAGTTFFVVANRTHPGNYEVYRVAAGGGELEQVTELGGVVSFSLAPSGDRLLLSRSWIDRHADLYVQAAEPGAEPLRLTDTVSDRYASIDWVIPDIVEVPSSHVDEPIYTKLYVPPNYEAGSGRRHPAVMFVHGAGYTQNSHMGWPYYFREFMFHTLLANEGYFVIDMDYRASKGYGRDWRTAIYRQMGYPELEDFADGVDWLVENYRVDRDRIGVYGGSYGGFMTFMALFREPELFAAGAALRPVADWTNYSHEYTSNILNTPEVDPVAYYRSSPLNFVEGLRQPLLIASGVQDDNVFFQDSILIVQRLLELKKPDFEMAVYPLDPHGFVHADAWLDEYRRIYRLMNETLK